MKLGVFLVLTLVVIVFNYARAQDYQIKVVTTQTSLLKNNRVEFGIAPPAQISNEIKRYMRGKPHQREGLNPFVSWDVNITAELVNLETGDSAKGIAFWYTDVKRDTATHYWNFLKTESPFRLRFSPSSAGKWEANFYATIKNGTKEHIGQSTFYVKNSDDPGHVIISKEHFNFERNQKIIYPAGVNLPFPYIANNLLYSQDPDEQLNLRAWENYRNDVQRFLDEGGKYFRLFMHPSSTDIEFEELGYYESRQHFAWEMDKILDLCEQNNGLINLNLMAHTLFMKLGDYHQFKYDYSDYWHDKSIWPYKDINPISGYSRLLSSKTPSDMFLNKRTLLYLQERIRYIMARWGYSTAISSFEIMSEPWHVDENNQTHEVPYGELTPAGDTARLAVYHYHSQIASYIKNELNIKSKPIGAVGRLPLGSSGIYSHNTPTLPAQIDSTWYDDNIDFISISFYSKSPAKAIVSKNSPTNESGENENSIACAIRKLQEAYDKPVIFAEADHGDNSHVCSDLEGHKIDIKRFAYTGAAGHYIWAAFMYPENEGSSGNRIDERKSWPQIIMAERYFNSPQFKKLLQRQLIQGRQKSSFAGSDQDVVEHQYIMDCSQSTAFGYIYNRTFNVFTAGQSTINKQSGCYLSDEDFQTPIAITWKPQKLKVSGLKWAMRYTVRYFDYTKGKLFYVQNERTSLFGKLTLKHPTLTPYKNGNPLFWYRIELEN
jgi:hypothetical protein